MLLLVRHGRTADNAAGLLLGRRRDPPLDDLGRAQAALVAARIADEGPVHRVISSPLARATETAVAFGLEVEVDERWIEVDYGALDGTPTAEVGPDTWRRWRSDAHFAPPGGESLQSVLDRVGSACAELLAGDGRQRTVVVSHVSPIKAAVAWALDASPLTAFHLFLAPGSITEVDRGPLGAVVRSFNDVAHLDAGLR